jgi:hypothetical protein
LPAAVPSDENPAIFHDPRDVLPEILDDTIFMIALDPLDITGDNLDDAALVPVSMCAPDVGASLGWCSNSPDVVTDVDKTFQEDGDLISFYTCNDY